MQKTKLIDFLRTFDKAEIKRFGDFVASPFFNKDERLVKLFHHIKKYHPEYDTHMLLKDRVFKKVFPGTVMPVAYQNKLVFGLSKLAEEFLTQMKFEEKKRLKDVVRLEGFSRKGLENTFFADADKLVNFYKKENEKDIDFYFHFSQIYKIIYFHKKYNKILDAKNAFKNYCNFLAWFFIGSFQYSEFIIKNFERTISKKIEYLDIRNLLTILFSYFKKPPKNIIILREVGHLFINKISYANYFQLKKIITSNYLILGKEKKGLFVLLINYCSLMRHKINKQGLHEEKLNIYKFVLNEKILSIPDDIDLINFTNIVKLACKIKDFDWLERAVLNNLHSKKGSEKNNIIKYINITLDFVKGNYSKALIEFKNNQIENFVPSLRHDLYIIRLKIYLLIDLSDEFLSAVDSYERYIRRHNYYSPQIKKAGITMAQYFRKLYSIPDFELEKFYKLKIEVQNEGNILNRSWIIDRLNEILK